MLSPIKNNAASDKGVANGSFRAFGVIAKELSQVKTLIEKELSDCDETIRGLVSHISFGKGKMVRPGLVILSGLACGRITEEHSRAAAIIEMIHNATLLHDDVIDESKSRRGQPTLNQLEGNESAVLLGDFLLSRVFQMWAGLNGVASKIIASAAVRTCEGEIRQTARRGDFKLSEEEYIEIIGEKSAALFSGACAAGAALAGADEQKKNKFAEYGLNVGLAFQITDDLLDLTGKQSETGKDAGRDLDRNKMTLSVIHYLKTASEAEKDAIKRAVTGMAPNKANNGLLEKLRRSGSIEYAMGQADKFVERAIDTLACFGNTRYKDSLVETAKFVVGRTS